MEHNKTSKKRRACFVYYQHYGPLVYRAANALVDKGFTVDIIGLRGSRKQKVYEVFDNQHVYSIQMREGAEKHAIHYFLRLLLFCIKTTLLLSFLGIVKRYDFVHVTAPPDVMVFSALVPKLLGSKILLDIHDIGPEMYMRKLSVEEDRPVIKFVKFLERISARVSDHVITVTEHWKNRLVSRSVPKEKCSVILNVPDGKIFKPLRSGIRSESESFNLYYHGTIEEHFGVDTMIRAMPEIKEGIPNVNLHIYCHKEGRLLDELRVETKTLDLQETVIFHEAVPFFELPNILENADMGIVPTKGSVFSDEAVSMKSFEYVALGIPIVISGTKAHRFYYDNSMVRFFEPENSHELARAVVELYQDVHKREEIARETQTFMMKHGWEEHSKAIYTDMVDNMIA